MQKSNNKAIALLPVSGDRLKELREIEAKRYPRRVAKIERLIERDDIQENECGKDCSGASGTAQECAEMRQECIGASGTGKLAGTELEGAESGAFCADSPLRVSVGKADFVCKWAQSLGLENEQPIEIHDFSERIPEECDLRRLVWGKKVAIVGNGIPDRDESAEIDSCDIVVRFNNFYNYQSGKVGKKLDLLVITPSSAWLNLKDDETRGFSVIQREKPLVCFVRHEGRARWKKFATFFKGLKKVKMRNVSNFYQTMTTGGTFLAFAADHFDNCEIKCFGFGDNKGFHRYLQKDGKHYLGVCVKEFAIRERSLEICGRKRIFTNKAFDLYNPFSG